MFCVPEHRRLIKADYAQIELRLAAIMAPDRTMLDRFLADEDIHILTAATMLNLSPDQVTKEHRQLAKALNFGLLYGMGAPRLQSHAWKDYHVALTEAEAAQRRQQWMRLYKGIERWHRRTGQHKQLDTRTLLRRRRLGITRFTEMLNTPVQGSGADGLKLAMVRVFDDRHRYPDVQLVNVVHDELLFECDAHHAEEVGAWVKHHMEAAMQEVVQGKVPTPVDVMIGQSWAG
jgi:DNA polymerase I